MKTNRLALWVVRIRGIIVSLALIGMVGATFWFGESLAARFGQTASFQTEGAQAANVSVGDLLVAAR